MILIVPKRKRTYRKTVLNVPFLLHISVGASDVISFNMINIP
jgi:hypothetical protein